MANPFAGMVHANMPGPMGNVMQMMQSFNHFASNFKGDPKQKVQELLNSGQMSQEQYNVLQNMARQFQSMMPK